MARGGSPGAGPPVEADSGAEGYSSTMKQLESLSSKPAALAGVLAGAYVAVAGCWILFSGEIAAVWSSSIGDLRRLELAKGLVFVAVTGLGTFLLAFALMNRLRRKHLEAADAREALIVSERRALAGLLAASIAHDCNNIMTGLLADLDSVAEGELPPEGREVMGRVQSYVDRLRGLFRRLQTVGRAEGSAGAEDLDLVRAVSGTLEMLRGQPRLKLVDLAFEPCPALPLRATALLLDQVVMNLVLNAADATDGQGRIVVRVAQSGDDALLEVHDDGPGVPAELRAHVFEPFFSTRSEGRGLGLLAVRGCAEIHGGRVEVLDSDLGGACFRVRLPLRGLGSRAA